MPFHRSWFWLLALLLIAGAWWPVSRRGSATSGSPARDRLAQPVTPSSRTQALQASASAGPEPGPARLWDLLKQTDSVLVQVWSAEFVLRLVPDEFAGVWAQLRDQPASLVKDGVLRLFLRRWGQIDSSTALASVAGTPGMAPVERIRWENFVLEGWVTQAPAEAWQWGLDSFARLPTTRAADLQPGARRSGTGPDRMAALVQSLIEHGQFGQAAQLLGALPGAAMYETTGTPTPGGLAAAWVSFEPGAAVAWVEALPELPAKRSVLSRITAALTLNDPEAARSLVGRQTDPEAKGAAAGGLMLGYNARGEREGAIRWLLQNVGDNADGVFSGAIRFGLAGVGGAGLVDLAGERSLLGRMGEGAELPARALAVRAQRQHPAAAIEIILQYYPQNSQDASLRMVVADWAGRDPGSALLHVQQLTGISEATRTRLLAAVAGPASEPR